MKKPAWCGLVIEHLHYIILGLMTTTALGNGALFFASPNFSRPRTKRTSCCMAYWCHQLVSVRAGTKQTTVAPFFADSFALRIHALISRPYGGFIQQTPDHSCFSPSCSGVKNFAHLAFSGIAHTSNSNPNSALSLSKKSCGVACKSVALEKWIFILKTKKPARCGRVDLKIDGGRCYKSPYISILALS